MTNVVRIFEGEQDLHSAVQIALHQVGRAKLDFLSPAVKKVKDTTVFKIAPNDADNFNIFAHAIHTWA